jgi:hypothetical protein
MRALALLASRFERGADAADQQPLRQPSTYLEDVTMRTRSFTLPAAVALLLAACADHPDLPLAPGEGLHARGHGAFTYTTIMPPDATAATAFGIGPGGDIVGAFTVGGVTRGFLLHGGELTPIVYPGASVTQARGIGSGGEIVGTYKLPGDPPVRWRSFIRSAEGDYEDVTVPDHESIMLQRILPDGTLLGCVHGADMTASMKGLMIGRDGIRIDDIYASMHNGATPNGRRIAGLYRNRDAGDRVEAYVIDNGVFTPVLPPGAIFAEGYDMNPAGDAVGFYGFEEQVGGGGVAIRRRGFMLTRSGLSTIHFPGADVTDTRVFGINPGGDVVGHYIIGGVIRGFVARRTGGPDR